MLISKQSHLLSFWAWEPSSINSSMSKSLKITQQTGWVIQGLEDSYSLIPLDSLPAERHGPGTHEVYDDVAGRSAKRLVVNRWARWANASHARVYNLLLKMAFWLNGINSALRRERKIWSSGKFYESYFTFWYVRGMLKWIVFFFPYFHS